MRNVVWGPSAAVAMTLAGCGGGSGGDTLLGAGGGGASQSYQTLSSQAAVTSTLGGTAIANNSAIVTTSGTVQHDTGATTISDGTYTFVDPDGFDQNGVMTDGVATLKTDQTSFSGTHEYVLLYDVTYPSGGHTGVGGIVTQANDVPTGGTASYSGEAVAAYGDSTSSTSLDGGTAQVAVDFGAGQVDLTMTSFSASDGTTGAPVANPALDTIAVTGMNINGNAFSGGTISTTLGGTPVDVVGHNSTSLAAGNFFGFDAANNIPDEVGGVLLQQGDTGILAGAFVAD